MCVCSKGIFQDPFGRVWEAEALTQNFSLTAKHQSSLNLEGSATNLSVPGQNRPILFSRY